MFSLVTAANHVWLLDCWWNASTEDQAVDRIHRLGQTRPVFVHRYLIDDSIEDRSEYMNEMHAIIEILRSPRYPSSQDRFGRCSSCRYP